MEAIIGDICYPKSEALIIPANTKGIMSVGVPARISKAGLSKISKEVKKFITNNKVEVGQCIISGPGRLKRRGVKNIYHAVIKRLQSDFTTIYIVREALKNSLQMVVDDEMESVALCGLGIDFGEIDNKTVARLTFEICKKYENKIKIKIIDYSEEFITEINNLIRENNVITQ